MTSDRARKYGNKHARLAIVREGGTTRTGSIYMRIYIDFRDTVKPRIGPLYTSLVEKDCSNRV